MGGACDVRREPQATAHFKGQGINVDTQTRRLIGFAIAAVGAVITFIGLLADQIGVGDEGFGPRQVIATIIGLVVLAAGLIIALVLKTGATDEATEAVPGAGEVQPSEGQTSGY